MKFVTGMSVAAILILGSAAQALTLSTQWFVETWEGDAPGTVVSSSSQWTGDNDSYVVGGPGGGNPGNYGNLVGADDSSWVWTQTDFSNLTESQPTQIFTFDIEGQAGVSVGNRTEIYVLDSNGAQWMGWRGDGNFLAARNNGTIATVNLLPGWNNEMTIVYDYASGNIQWYHNGAFLGSQITTQGEWMERVEIHNNFAIDDFGVLGEIHIDNIQVGVPEPAALGLLLLGLPFLRRSR